MKLATISSADGATVAQFAPAAGMVGSSLRHRDAQLLDLRQGLDAYAERGSTMGIPLLYPWANRLAGFEYRTAGRSVVLPGGGTRVPLDPSGLPIHGLVPDLMRWSRAPGDQPSRLSARLAWRLPELLELFPFEHEVELDAEVGADATGAGTLTITTSVRATGADPVPVSFGFHPYLRLPGARREDCRLELPDMRRLVLDSRMIPTGERAPFQPRGLGLADTSWDDGFELLAQPARFAARTAGRGIAVELLEGFPYAQIYAPPGKDFICFEPMTAPANALRSGDGLTLLAPGDAHRAVFRISAWRE